MKIPDELFAAEQLGGLDVLNGTIEGLAAENRGVLVKRVVVARWALPGILSGLPVGRTAGWGMIWMVSAWVITASVLLYQ